MKLYRSERFITEQAKFAKNLEEHRGAEIIDDEDGDASTPRPVQPNRVVRGSNWANASTAALPGSQPSLALWKRVAARLRRPECNEDTILLGTNESLQPP